MVSSSPVFGQSQHKRLPVNLANFRIADHPDTIHPQVRGTVTSCYLEVFAVYARLPLLDVAGPGVGAVGWHSRFGEVEFAHHGCPAGSVAEVASVPQAEHREDGGIVLADGFRQPICLASKSPSIPW